MNNHGKEAQHQIQPRLLTGDSLRSHIITRLRSLGLEPQIMAFRTILASGVNIFVDIPQNTADSAFRRRLLGAHYDGCELHDNLGGVLSLLEVAALLCQKTTRQAWRIAFWDAEERFQQGSRAYLSLARPEQKATETAPRISTCPGENEIYIDVDGLGIGPNLLSRRVGTRTWNQCSGDLEFLLDGDVFASVGIPTFHIFSGPKIFADIYNSEGLAGCHHEVLQKGLASFSNWQSAMPACLQGLMRFVTAWEYLPLEQALLEARTLCLT